MYMIIYIICIKNIYDYKLNAYENRSSKEMKQKPTELKR